ncbi:MAG: ABC transporter ATP-binding protein [Gammaproteobacteria bacterium]|nr:ABC transporter ATP-binding protein [Gammaproteobacteria bacterium]
MSKPDKPPATSDQSPADSQDSGSSVTPFIKLDCVTHSYTESDSVHTVLKKTSLSIHHSEKVALLGRSGSGKSTLLNLISGIDLPDNGRIHFDGMDIVSLDETARTIFRRQHIGFIYQFFNLVPSLTALENVALALELNGITGKLARERSLSMLERLGIADRAQQFPTRLSGGEQQRVAIARALVHSPAVVLADEPTGNLDAKSGSEVLNLLNDTVVDSGCALLLVTHSLTVAQTADRVLTLEEGTISEQVGDFAW